MALLVPVAGFLPADASCGSAVLSQSAARVHRDVRRSPVLRAEACGLPRVGGERFFLDEVRDRTHARPQAWENTVLRSGVLLVDSFSVFVLRLALADESDGKPSLCCCSPS